MFVFKEDSDNCNIYVDAIIIYTISMMRQPNQAQKEMNVFLKLLTI